MPQILTYETTLPPEEVTVGAAVFFTNERWQVQSQSPRVCTLVGKPPLMAGFWKVIVMILGFLFCIVPGIIAWFSLVRDAYKLHNLVINANPTSLGSTVMITFPQHAALMVHRFLSSLPQRVTASPALVEEHYAPAASSLPQLPANTPAQISSRNVDVLPLTTDYSNVPYTAPSAQPPTPGIGAHLQAFSRRVVENRKAGLIFVSVAMVLLLSITVFGVYFLWYSNTAVEQKLDAAINKGDLFKPEGQSAYDFYHQLKKAGADAKVLAPFEDKLIPRITTQPLKLISDFAVPTNPEPVATEWQNALKPMQWACEMRPNDNGLNAREKYIEGRIAFISNQKDQALDLWKKASDLDRTWAMPPNGVGVIYNEKKSFETARKYLFEAIRREASWAVPYNSIGTSYFFEKKYDDAWTYYMKAIERSSNWARPHVWLGDVAMRRNDFATATDEYQKALDLAQSGNTALDLNDIKKRLDQAKQKSQQAAESEIIN